MLTNSGKTFFDWLPFVPSPAIPNGKSGRIEYLDGWRAVAVALVVMAHTLSVYGINILTFGTLGVFLFFGISGYIITRLLLLEHVRTGKIDLRAFYVRRVARIMPPLLIYTLAIVALLPNREIGWQAVRAVTFTCNMGFGGTSCTRIFEHTWSLAFEEQFYLIYPLLLAGLLRWWQILLVALWVVPFFVPVPFIGQGGFVRIALIMALGATYAAYEAKLSAYLARLPRLLLLLMPAVLFGWAALEPSPVQILLGALLPFATIVTLFGLPLAFPTLKGLLSMGVVTRIGLYSYTFYLWQQFFSYPWSWNTGPMPLLGIGAGLAIAALSYHSIENVCRGWARKYNNWRQSQLVQPAT